MSDMYQRHKKTVQFPNNMGYFKTKQIRGPIPSHCAYHVDQHVKAGWTARDKPIQEADGHWTQWIDITVMKDGKK